MWSIVDTKDGHNDEPLPSQCRDAPLVIASANTPYYRCRLAETMGDLSQTSFEDGSNFIPIKTIDMLDLSKRPSIGLNRIVFEGWRQIMLPTISHLEFTSVDDQSMILVSEDDLRLGNDVSPQSL